MLNQQQIQTIEPRIRTIQIVCGSLIMGLMTMAVIFVVAMGPEFIPKLGILQMVGIGMAVPVILMSFILPTGIRRNSLRQSLSDEQKNDPFQDEVITQALASVQTSSIIRFALLEGAAIMNLIFWFVEKSLYNLVVVGIALGLMVAFFPFSGRIIDTIQSDLTGIRSE